MIDVLIKSEKGMKIHLSFHILFSFYMYISFGRIARKFMLIIQFTTTDSFQTQADIEVIVMASSSPQHSFSILSLSFWQHHLPSFEEVVRPVPITLNLWLPPP